MTSRTCALPTAPASATATAPAVAASARTPAAPADAFLELMQALCEPGPSLPTTALPAEPEPAAEGEAAVEAVASDAALPAWLGPAWLPAPPLPPAAMAAGRPAAADTPPLADAAGSAQEPARDLHAAGGVAPRPGATIGHDVGAAPSSRLDGVSDFQALVASAATTASTAMRDEAPPAAAAAPIGMAGLAPAFPPGPGDIATPPPMHEAALSAAPGSPRFGTELAGELQFMLGAGMQQAQLHLNPAELGPIQVQLTLHAQSAELQLAASQPGTREALSQALPELREMLAGQGLSLGQAQVSGGDAQRQPPQPPAAERTAGGPAPGARGSSAAGDAAAPAVPLRIARGLLDLYA